MGINFEIEDMLGILKVKFFGRKLNIKLIR